MAISKNPSLNFIVMLMMLSHYALAEPTQEPGAAAVENIVSKFLNWSAHPGTADSGNPFRAQLLKAGPSAVGPLIRQARGTAKEVAVIWTLGEIGSSHGFPFLLTSYAVGPDDRLAISIGACCSEPEIQYLFDSEVLAKQDLRILMATIYGSHWNEVKDLADFALRDETVKRIDRLRAECKRRSQPIGG